jgi:2'-5' RNA ligase
MYSIASLVEIEKTKNWPQIESVCQYSGIIPNTIPHFSWQTAENYHLDQTREKLVALAKSIENFSFTTSGIGIFPNDRKIIFLIIVKSRKLLEIHEQIWHELLPYSINPRMHYSPENWIPHISLNFQNLTTDQFQCSLDELLKIDLQFTFQVNEFGILYLNEDISGVDFTAPLLKEGKK